MGIGYRSYRADTRGGHDGSMPSFKSLIVNIIIIAVVNLVAITSDLLNTSRAIWIPLLS